MKISPRTLRILFGVIWIIAGVGKLISLNFVAKTLGIFTETCLLPFYTQFISSFVLPNAFVIVLCVSITEIFAGILILCSRIYAKIGLVIAILLNIAYLPLGIPQVFINLVFILAELWLLTQNLDENILKILLKR